MIVRPAAKPASQPIEWHAVDVSVNPRQPGVPVRLNIATLGKPDVIIFLGMGSEILTTRRRMRLYRAEGLTNLAVVSALPYWLVNPQADDLLSLAVGGPATAAAYIRQKYGVQLLNVVAESQAAPATVEAAIKAPDVLNGKFALIGAHGIVKLTRRQLMARMGASILRPRRSVSGHNAGIGSKVAMRLVQDMARNSAQTEFGLAFDSRSSLQKLSAARPGDVRIFSGRLDKLFPPQEIIHQLQPLHLEGLLQVVSGGHAVIDSKESMQDNIRILEWCRN